MKYRERKKRPSFLFGKICSLFVIFAILVSTTTALLVARSSSANAGGSLVANQTQRLLLGNDNMLNAGDVIEIETIIFNNASMTETIVIVDSVPIGTVCVPELLEPRQISQCNGVYTVTQVDIDQGLFELTSLINNLLNVSSMSNLTQNTVALLRVSQEFDFDDESGNITVVVHLENIGTETLLNVTSTSFDGILSPLLEPMKSVNFTYTRSTNQDDTMVFLNETGAGIGTTSARSVSDFSSVLVTIEPETDFLVVQQTQNVLFGEDEMLNAGDVIEIRTTIFNNASRTRLQNLTLVDSTFVETVCEPMGLNNIIVAIEPQETIECYGIYIITQHDIDNEVFTLVSTIENVINVTSVGNLTQTTFGSLMVSQMFELDLGGDVFFDTTDFIYVTVKLMNTGTETLLNLTSTNFDGILVSILEPMQAVNFTYIRNLTQSDLDERMLMLNETAVAIGTTSAQPVTGVSSVLVNTTQPIAPRLFTTTTFMQSSTCAQIGSIAQIQVLVENTGTGMGTNVQIMSSLVGSNLICSPMGVDNVISEIMPGQTLACNGGYMLTGNDVRYGFDTPLSTVTSIASNPLTESVSFTYQGANELYYPLFSPGVNVSNGVSVIDARPSSDFQVLRFISANPGGCRNRIENPGYRNVRFRSYVIKDIRLNLQKHLYAILRVRELNTGRIRFITNPPNLFTNWTYSGTNFNWNPIAGTASRTTSIATGTWRMDQLPDTISIQIRFEGNIDARDVVYFRFWEIVDTTN